MCERISKYDRQEFSQYQARLFLLGEQLSVLNFERGKEKKMNTWGGGGGLKNSHYRYLP